MRSFFRFIVAAPRLSLAGLAFSSLRQGTRLGKGPQVFAAGDETSEADK
jgi:hypothetical protein